MDDSTKPSNLGTSERRAQPRVPITLPLLLRFGAEVAYARSSNISAGGMFVMSEKRPAPTTAIQITAVLPDTTQLILPAEVRWGTSEGFGVQFGRLEAQATYAIGKLVANRSRA